MSAELAENEVYLTLKQVAEILNLSKVTVYRLVHENKLTAYGVTRKHIFRQSEVLALRNTPKSFTRETDTERKS